MSGTQSSIIIPRSLEILRNKYTVTAYQWRGARHLSPLCTEAVRSGPHVPGMKGRQCARQWPSPAAAAGHVQGLHYDGNICNRKPNRNIGNMAASVFSDVPMGAPIEVFALSKRYNEDPNPNKVDLGVGGMSTSSIYFYSCTSTARLIPFCKRVCYDDSNDIEGRFLLLATNANRK